MGEEREREETLAEFDRDARNEEKLATSWPRRFKADSSVSGRSFLSLLFHSRVFSDSKLLTHILARK